MKNKPIYSDPFDGYRELTLRGIVLGILITIVFTASNIYLGLKVGLTFASSIPAAVLSMAILKWAKDSNILENNQVQTQASAAGTLSSVIFVLPGLLMIGYWQDFPFWQTALICMAGGILGVIFTIPLRHVMVVNSPLPYPEGIAAAEILKTASKGRIANAQGEIIQEAESSSAATTHQSSNAKEIVYGGLFAALISFMTGGLRLLTDSSSLWLKASAAIFQIPLGYSLALLGAGSLIGIGSGIAILVGIAITWGVAVPFFSAIAPMPEQLDIATYANQIWKEKVRMIGVGTIGIAAIWTLLVLFKPMLQGVKLSIQAYQSKTDQHSVPRASRDLPPKYMLLMISLVAVLLYVTFYYFVASSGLALTWAWALVALVTVLTMLIGFLVAAACGYMAGLVGSSSSPISGIGILAILLFSVLLLMLSHSVSEQQGQNLNHFLTALAIFATSAVVAIAAIANDNLQDLKTGYLLHATPAKQQISLMIGCVVGALIIAPVLELLYYAYGFSGALPRANMDLSQTLAAPQALLMSTIAQGIFSQQLLWDYIFIGIVLGAVLILIDFILKRISHGHLALPVLAVGLGIYLPPSVNIPLFFGALLFWLIKRHVRRQNNGEARLLQVENRGTLFAAGLIVGESLMGVVLAMIIVTSTSLGGSDAPLAIALPNWELMANILGFMVFIFAMWLFCKRCLSA
ncbi:OPT family oligopeptide transporter [Acinetobacter larvae]|uniref:Oligopeptide transporter, OPT family n=1 Tax=Acinetobacter larvae TaxID=1789224 RepID=A0A1B2LX59_9GAMM|nr:oligopeptide transporter, OPT family [Acinetobacter larvae]AOA57516.1 oligopeptide transporter, OPT family [Acinetobacter larvae]